ncbi:hypothetical protein KPSA1_02335 [Pseudomonas syringae pv. actinidiae]|nr:hypothetical protein KPSA1_02335 [Pseudomonas syringae pv. actinidiae]
MKKPVRRTDTLHHSSAMQLNESWPRTTYEAATYSVIRSR